MMDTVTQLFESVLEISLFASAMIMVVLLIRAFAKDRINIKVISFLWLLVVLRLCIPGMLASPVHIDGLFPEEETISVQSDAVGSDSSYEIEDNTAINTTPRLAGASDNELNGRTLNGLTVSASKEFSFWDKAANFIQSLDLWVVAFIIWITGSAIVLLLAVKESIVFGLYIKKNSITISDKEILDIVNAHKTINKIQRSVRISACSSIQMPMAIGVFKPHILLPAQMIDRLERRHLEPILLHEICHIKRNDILKSYLYIMAKALHWFNPLVWIGIKKMKEDMEFACDQHVLKLLDKEQGIEYCESLIQATRFLKAIRIPQFATSLCEKKSNLKVRIVKMIKPQKKSKKAAAISLVLAMVMIFACFTTACQPTPEEEVVVGKDGLSDLIQSTASASSSVSAASSDELYTKLDAPKHWGLETTALSDKLNIKADVDLELPGVSQLPAATASISEFTQEDLDKIAEVLGVGDAEWTEHNKGTKESIEQWLIDAQARLAEYKAEGNDEMVEKMEEDIEGYKQWYIDAPYESELKNIEFKIGVISSWEDQTSGDTQTINGFDGTTQVDGQTFYFYAGSDADDDSVTQVDTSFGNATFGGDATFAAVNIDAPYGVSLTKEQAAEQASEIAAQLTDGLSLCYITPATAGREDISRNWGWACVFMREINGCPTAYERTERPFSIEAQNVPVNYEKMIIVMDDAGMVSFTWGIPMTIESIDNPDVSLLSFDEISKRAIEQIAQRYASAVGEDIVNGIDLGDPGCTANITKAELGLMRVDKASSDDYYYIPVWKFFIDLEHTDGYYERMGISPYDEEYFDEDGNPTDFLYSNINFEYSLGLGYDVVTINALDGSTIDSDLGY